MQPNPFDFDFDACLTEEDHEAALDLVTAENNRKILRHALDILRMDKRQLVAWINAQGDFAALAHDTALVAEFGEMLEKLAFLVKHAANTINLVMRDPGSAVLIGSGGGNA